MFLLNLSFAEFAALFSVISAGVFALYLFDRSRRRQTVATLRFWKPAEFPVQMNQRRKVQQPLSLILQILGIALLLLAIAQLKWGSRERNMRDHVLILDTSAWMGAQGSQGGILMQEAKGLALAWLKSVPSDDRVMVLRADAAATPATRFERNKQTVERAIRESQPAASALQLGQALRFASEFQKLHSESSGEIVYAGAARMGDVDVATVPANLRVLPVDGPSDNVGLRRMGLRRSSTDPEAWDIFVSVKNYSSSPRAVPIGLQFAGSPAGTRTLQLKPDAEMEATFTYRTRANGIVEAKLLASDPFPQDDRAVLEIPQQKQLRIAVYTNEPELLRPVLSANPNMVATFQAPAAYQPDPADTDLMILDRFAPPQAPKHDTLWIEPPAAQSPVPVSGQKAAAKLTRWTEDELLGAGLRTKDLEIEQSVTYRPAGTDIVIAESDGAALIVARPGAVKNVVIGFHPIKTRMRYELATPLLFANTIRWMEPESFRRWQLNGGHVGSVAVKTEGKVDPSAVRVMDEQGAPVPFTMADGEVRFFTNQPGNIRVMTGDRDYSYSLTVPEVGDRVWEIPQKVRRGIPARPVVGASSTDLWYWLALAGLAVLATEWFLYGRHRMRVRTATVSTMPPIATDGARKAS
ncbi:hypothetical protein F183_A34130 [Bryobacterales bacterium F-183]|nr:hypothetical protein F183_A34130 [Bryobacterales bacterium F-183]